MHHGKQQEQSLKSGPTWLKLTQTLENRKPMLYMWTKWNNSTSFWMWWWPDNWHYEGRRAKRRKDCLGRIRSKDPEGNTTENPNKENYTTIWMSSRSDCSTSVSTLQSPEECPEERPDPTLHYYYYYYYYLLIDLGCDDVVLFTYGRGVKFDLFWLVLSSEKK